MIIVFIDIYKYIELNFFFLFRRTRTSDGLFFFIVTYNGFSRTLLKFLKVFDYYLIYLIHIF